MVLIFGSSHKNELINVNILVLGDKSQGKSSLLMTYFKEFPSEEILPEKFSPPPRNMMKYGQQVVLKCFDTVEFMNLSEAKPTVVLILASTKANLENVNSYWIPEVTSKWKHLPVILVGSKSDFRSGQLAKDFRECASTFVHRHPNVVEFHEISTITPGGGIDKLFNSAIMQGMACSSVVGAFFDSAFKRSEYVGIVKHEKHYRAQIEEVSPKSCKVRYIDSPFMFGNVETIKRRVRVKEWRTDSWLPLLFEELNILSTPVAKLVAAFAGIRKEDFNFIEKEVKVHTTLELNKFQELIVAKALAAWESSNKS